MGANAFIAYGKNEIAEGREALGGAPQVVLECVGAEGMLSKAVMHSAQFGRVISLGFCTAPDAVIPAIASYKCVSMQFAVGYTMKEFLYIADQMDKGHADPKAIITRDILARAAARDDRGIARPQQRNQGPGSRYFFFRLIEAPSHTKSLMASLISASLAMTGRKYPVLEYDRRKHREKMTPAPGVSDQRAARGNFSSSPPRRG
jgi:hypothetical protein